MKAKRVSVGVVLVLATIGGGLIIPTVRHVRAQAIGQETAARMKNLVMALHSCAEVHKAMPPAFDSFAGLPAPASVHVHLLPFLDQQALYQAYSQQAQGSGDASLVGFHAPGDRTLGNGAGVQNFAASLLVFSDVGFRSGGKLIPLSGVMPGHVRLGAIPDGASNTVFFATKLSACVQEFGAYGILIDGGSRYDANPMSPFAAFFADSLGERAAHPSDPEAIFQLGPRDGECRIWPRMAQSYDRQKITVVLGDGAVRTVTQSISPSTWISSLRPADGAVIGNDW